MKIIQNHKTLAASWLAACEHLALVPGHQDFTVLLHIEEPLLVRPADRQAARTLNKFLVDHGAYGTHTVAETIFPGYEYMRRGAAGVYAYPEAIFSRVKAHDESTWGTYAQRMLNPRKDYKGRTYVPLEACIKKMKDKVPWKAAHELGFFDLALYEDDQDRTHRRGGPCLSHLSFKVMPEKRLQLTAMYRLHYYVERAYGNLLGLARLQTFVAQEVGLSVGPLVCHSTMATLDQEGGWKMGEIKALIANCRAEYTSTVPNPSAENNVV